MPSLYRPPWRRVKAFRGRKHNNVTDMRYARGVTRWRQIAETLSEDVAEARFADGRLPTEPELATRFGVNRHTVRRAVGVLADQGLVRVEQGRGTFVASGHIDYLVGRRTRFSANLQREGYAPGHELLGHLIGPADPATAQELRLRPGDEIVVLETLGRADGIPVSYALHHFPAARFAALPESFIRTGSITAALNSCGVADYTRRITRLLARMPSELEAHHLQQPASRPVLYSGSTSTR